MNKIKINKIKQRFDVKVDLPASKSIMLRDLFLAALAQGRSLIKNFENSLDCVVMKQALLKLGVKITDQNGQAIKILGKAGKFSHTKKRIFCGGSGVSARLLMALSLLRSGKTVLSGNQSLKNRPQHYLIKAIQELGAQVKAPKPGFLPLEVTGGANGKNMVKLKGDVSSQYFTALLMIAPLLAKGLVIKVIKELVSKPYIDITLAEMKKFGPTVKNLNYQTFIVKPGKYQAVDLTVEADASAASYFMAMATLHGGKITMTNLGKNSQQGDLNFFKICEKLGAKLELKQKSITITGKKTKKLKLLKKPVDMEAIPDTAPTLMAMAPFIPGGVTIINIGTLKHKECDRIEAPARELKKLGVAVKTGKDYIKIQHKKNWDKSKINNIALDTYDDHRMAMSLAVLASNIGDIAINDPKCVDKTFPGFWRELKKLYQITKK
ncbi:MAG: 3-phosphoshikimate 1-carboxyvinyltransferase [Candidatus Moranbacteria bacterium]|nr:3-phosphoshikimate 1-carboxyvinyltransferase [Candidatus Moranbacteria bacterium]